MFVRYCAALIVALSTLPGFALDNPLGVFSTDTSIVVRASSPSVLSAKSKAFLEQAAPPVAPSAEQIGPGMGSLIGNPTLQGVDAERDWYLAVIFQAESQPHLIFAIPAKDIEALKTAIGTEMHSRAYEDWLVYSRTKEAIDALPEAPAPATESIQGAMDEAGAKMFSSGEVALFVNLPALRETFQTQIDEFKKQMAEELDAAEKPDDPQSIAGVKYGRKMLELALEVLDSSTGLAMNVAIREDAIVGEAVFVVEPESKTGQFLAKQEPSDLSLLDKLPAGSMAYLGAAGGLNELVRLSSEMIMNLPATDDASKEAMAKLMEHDFQETAGSFDIGNVEQGAYRGIGLTRVGSAEGYMADLRAWAKEMTHIESSGVQQDITWQPEAETIGGTKVDVVQTVMTIGPEADPTGNINRLMKSFLGEEGMTQRVAVVGDLVVQSVGGGQEQMQTAIEAAQGGAEGESADKTALAGLREELGGQGQMLVVYDLPRLAAGFLSLMIESGMAPLPPNTAGAIDELKLSPSYGGTRISIDGHRVHFREIIPAEQVKGLVELGTALQQAGQGGN